MSTLCEAAYLLSSFVETCTPGGAVVTRCADRCFLLRDGSAVQRSDFCYLSSRGIDERGEKMDSVLARHGACFLHVV
jgi:hypothetical protein